MLIMDEITEELMCREGTTLNAVWLYSESEPTTGLQNDQVGWGKGNIEICEGKM